MHRPTNRNFLIFILYSSNIDMRVLEIFINRNIAWKGRPITSQIYSWILNHPCNTFCFLVRIPGWWHCFSTPASLHSTTIPSKCLVSNFEKMCSWSYIVITMPW